MARLKLSSFVVRLAFVAVLAVILNVNLTLWRTSYTDTLQQSVKRMEALPLVKKLGEEIQDLEARVEAIPFVRRIEEEISHALHFDRPSDAPVTISVGGNGVGGDSSSSSSSSSSSGGMSTSDVGALSTGSSSSSSSSSSHLAGSPAAGTPPPPPPLLPQQQQQPAAFQRSDGPIDTSLVEDLQLPAFASDFSEFVFGALIERTAGSWDLHLTAMLLCHFMLEPHNRSVQGFQCMPCPRPLSAFAKALCRCLAHPHHLPCPHLTAPHRTALTARCGPSACTRR